MRSLKEYEHPHALELRDEALVRLLDSFYFWHVAPPPSARAWAFFLLPPFLIERASW